MVHEIERGFVISSHQVWMPGLYKTRRAANYAFRFCDCILHTLSGKLITFEMLQAQPKRCARCAAANQK